MKIKHINWYLSGGALLFILFFLWLIVVTKHHHGEFQDVQAFKQSFIQYNQIPYFKTQGKLFYHEWIVIPYHNIDVCGVFKDSVDVFMDDREITNSHRGESCVFKWEDRLESRDGIPAARGQFDELLEENSCYDKNLEFDCYWFQTVGTHCRFLVNPQTQLFILHVSAR